jgi:hypothetical protein
MRPFKLYILINILGIVINAFGISSATSYYNFDSKSAISVFIWSFIGYSIKTCFFTLPIMRLNRFNQFSLKILYCFLPFIFITLWYVFILLFSLDFLIFDFSFGYISRFPHGLIQMVTMLMMCILTMLITININNSEIKV